jgi:hypothetical protein
MSGEAEEPRESFFAPLSASAEPVATVEVIPGVRISQAQIDAAVKATSGSETLIHPFAARDERDAAKEKFFEDIRQDIKASRSVIQEMMERLRTPVDMQEKYVSYDSMPAPLKRVVKAYIDVEEANKELTEAIKALGSSSLKPDV